MIKFNSDLFRIANMCASTEAARYYLNGVFVEPCKKAVGVTLTATDGHSLVTIYDAEGEAPAGGVILQADKPALAMLKRGKRMEKRVAMASGERGRVSATLLDYSSVTDSPPADAGAAVLEIVDGSFPDWRRIVPEYPEERKSVPSFNASLVGRMADVANELAKLRGERSAQVHIAAADASSPAIVRLSDERALGVIMPLRGAESLCKPYWL